MSDTVITKFDNQEQIPQADKIMLQIIEDASQKIAKKYNIEACGFGLAGKFERISLEFQVFRPLTKREARNMLLDCEKQILANINNNKKISSHLTNYPFTEKNVETTFYIYSKDGHRLNHPAISVATIYSQGIEFITNDPENDFKYKETIEESRKKAQTLNEQYLKTLAQEPHEKKMYTHSDSRVGCRSTYCSKMISHTRRKSLA